MKYFLRWHPLFLHITHIENLNEKWFVNRTYQAKPPRENVANGLNGFFKKYGQKVAFSLHFHFNCFTLYNILIKRLKSREIKHKKLFIGEKWQISLIFLNQIFHHNLFRDKVFMGHCILLFILCNNFRG